MSLILLPNEIIINILQYDNCINTLPAYVCICTNTYSRSDNYYKLLGAIDANMINFIRQLLITDRVLTINNIYNIDYGRFNYPPTLMLYNKSITKLLAQLTLNKFSKCILKYNTIRMMTLCNIVYNIVLYKYESLNIDTSVTLTSNLGHRTKIIKKYFHLGVISHLINIGVQTYLDINIYDEPITDIECEFLIDIVNYIFALINESHRYKYIKHVIYHDNHLIGMHPIKKIIIFISSNNLNKLATL